ncbi:MAG: 1-phosphofructokinase [Clostridia bacterium]|nr:1-phosphofructokinase [Clostridia bacterium]
MVYTLTLNPALDYVVKVPDYRNGQVNRAGETAFLPGGKGINVSIMLKHLGINSVPLGFAAGFTGKELERYLICEGCVPEFVYLAEGNTRINVKLKAGTETEINAPGPKVTERELEALKAQIAGLESGDFLVLAGSIPKGLPESIYRDIMADLQGKGVNVAVDTEGDALLQTLPYQPFLIKPNHHELGDIFGVEINTKEMAAEYARKLQKQGARNVLVSMAGQGAVLATENGKGFAAEAPKGTVVNSTGAGDSTVAGFLVGYLETEDYETAFLKGICSGSATAFSQGLGTAEEVEELLQSASATGI